MQACTAWLHRVSEQFTFQLDTKCGHSSWQQHCGSTGSKRLGMGPFLGVWVWSLHSLPVEGLPGDRLRWLQAERACFRLRV